MRYFILGPLEVRDDSAVVALGGPKPRAVLAVLLLHANTAVSAERLAMALWGDDAPPRAVKTLQVHVSRLRKALGDEVIDTSAAGYRLRVAPGDLDLHRFEQLVAEARDSTEPDRAAELLRAALALWRGPALADIAREAAIQTEIARLEDQRLTAYELRVEADLQLGREAEIVGELQREVTAQPARERLAGQLMLALYRCGRQAEALEAYREARSRLIDEAGIEPGPDLRELHAAILRQDRALLGRHVTPLPRELEAATAERIEGRDVELAWLRDRWRQVSSGSGAVVMLRGERGIGKRRLAAELAAEAHVRGATVLFADGEGPPASALGVLARARRAPGPTLLIVDHADSAPSAVREELAAFGALVADMPVLAVVLGENGDDDRDGLVLSPLDLGAVHAIVTRYSPEPTDEEPPAEWLLGASRGVPRLVHQLARQWARREAGRRVGTAAERTAARRADLRAMEKQLAADIVLMETSRDDAPPGDAAVIVCPFKGPAAFQVADAPFFFGRERLVAELVARLVGTPLLAIVGPSGSGKSSVLRAGLLPALSAGVLPGSDRWPQVLVRPGAHPLAELRGALAQVPDGPVVVAVDQFEEAFTICQDDAERSRFVAELVRLAREGDGDGAVVLAMRADFYGRCADYAELSKLASSGHVLVGAMRTEELRRAVECPAQRAGLEVEPQLIDALVADVAGEPGALPLLSTALLELWQERDGRHLRHAAYERAGGVRGAVARLGENAYTPLDDAQQAVARRVLLSLAAIGEDGSVERRRIAPDELGEGSAEIVERLANARVLTVHAGTVELAHEALLREWPRLRDWLVDDRDTLRVYERLRSSAREWVRLNRDDGALLRGAQLAEASASVTHDGFTLTGVEREFLSASERAAQRERAARVRRVRLAFAALATGLVAIGVVALIAIDQRAEAERERNAALSRSLALQSAQLLSSDPALALRLAMAADDITPTAQAAAALRQATLGYRQLLDVRADGVQAQTAAFSPDGRRFVTGGNGGVARLWDAGSGRAVAELGARHGTLLSARFSPRGDRIALGFQDGTVVVTGSALGTPRELQPREQAPANRVAFSRDGERVAVAMGDGTARILPVAGGAPLVIGAPETPAVRGLDLDAAGRVVTADDDGDVKLWNADGTPSRQLREGVQIPARDARFSPDGRLVLAVGEDGAARLWDAGSGELTAEVPGGPRKLTSAAFSGDGHRFAAASYDGAVRVWTTEGASELFELRGQRARVLDVGFGASSDRLVSAGDDGTAKVWDASGIQAFYGQAELTNADYSPSGKWIATGGWDGDVRIWNPGTGELVRRLDGPAGYAPAYFSPISDELAVGRDAASSVLRWTPPEGSPTTGAELPDGTGIAVATFDPTGTRLVYAGYNENLIEIRDVRSGETIRLGGAPEAVVDAQASPDGRQAVAAGLDGVLYQWELARPGKPIRALRGHVGRINTVEYGAGGRIATAGVDRTVRVWDPQTGHAVVLHGHTDEVNAAVFTPDGTRLLSASADGTVRLWSATGGEPLATLEEEPDVPLYDVSLGPDGMIATLDDHQVVRVFRCTVCGELDDLRAAARKLRPRPLTDEERRRFLR